MRYTNERVTPADIDRFDLKALSQRYQFVFTGLSWTIDHDRQSFLLLVRRNPEDLNEVIFVFLWDGELTEEVLRVQTDRSPDRRYLMHWHLLTAPVQARPPQEADRYRQRMSAFKEALTAYKSRGLNSAADMTYVIDFDF